MTVQDEKTSEGAQVPHPGPAAYVVWAESGNCIIWTTDKAQAAGCAAKYERPMRALYDQDVVIGLASQVMQLTASQSSSACTAVPSTGAEGGEA